ncbi:MAG: hypothetical protein AB1861_29670 [Cyanobacteriota bacterium]
MKLLTTAIEPKLTTKSTHTYGELHETPRSNTNPLDECNLHNSGICA